VSKPIMEVLDGVPRNPPPVWLVQAGRDVPEDGALRDATLPADRFTEGDFRVGHVLSQAWSLLSRNFLRFFVVTAAAAVPQAASSTIGDPFHVLQLAGIKLEGFGPLLGHVLTTVSEAAVLYGAFQNMRGEPVNLGESMRVGLRRFFPVVGVALTMTILGVLGLIVFVVPGLMFFTMSFVAIPACVVDKRGVFASIGRSSDLTRGYRWKIFALMLFWYVSDAIAEGVIDAVTSATGAVPAFAAYVIWNGIWGAFYAIFAVVTYHDLRVAKEGVDTAQIAAVFE
jgi:hypothetical protein